MRALFAIAAVGMMAVSVPALAQEAGAPGAIGTGGGLTGSNPPINPGWNYDYNRGPGYGYGYGYRGPGVEYGPPVGYYGAPGYYDGPGMIEGRGAADDYNNYPGYAYPDSRW